MTGDLLTTLREIEAQEEPWADSWLTADERKGLR